MKVGEDHNGQHTGNPVGCNPALRSERFERVRQPFRKAMLPVHTKPEAGDRNADLRCGDVAVLLTRVADDLPHESGHPVPLGRQALDSRAGHTHYGEFRRHKQSVEKDKDEDDQNREETIHRNPPSQQRQSV